MTNDILITKDGDLYLDPVKADIQLTGSIAQGIMIRLRWFFNEWVLNPSMGVPYYEDIFGKNPNLIKIRSIINEQIYSVEGVDVVTSLEISVDSVKRIATINYSVQSLEGPIANEVMIYG